MFVGLAQEEWLESSFLKGLLLSQVYVAMSRISQILYGNHLIAVPRSVP